METNEGFKMTPAMIIKAMQAVVYGDLFMRVLYATRPYEKEKGAANRLHKKWRNRVIDSLSVRKPNFGEFKRNVVENVSLVECYRDMVKNNA